MTDVFISYSHDDQERVRRLVQALEAEGYSVWWDHTIPPGQSWDTFIARGIREAKAAIVVWSRHSVGSEWVKEEATLSRGDGKYIPVCVDDVSPPMGFARIQAANLVDWSGDRNHAQWRLLVRAVSDLVRGGATGGAQASQGPAPQPKAPAYSAPSAQPPQTPGLSGRTMGLIALAAVAVLAIGVFVSTRGEQATIEAPPAEVSFDAPNDAKPQDQGATDGVSDAELERLRRENDLIRERASAEESARVAAEEEARRLREQAAAQPVSSPVGSWYGTIIWTPDAGGEDYTSTATWTMRSDGSMSTSSDEHGTWTRDGSSFVMNYLSSSGANPIIRGSVNGNTLTATGRIDGWNGYLTATRQ